MPSFGTRPHSFNPIVLGPHLFAPDLATTRAVSFPRPILDLLLLSRVPRSYALYRGAPPPTQAFRRAFNEAMIAAYIL